MIYLSLNIYIDIPEIIYLGPGTKNLFRIYAKIISIYGDIYVASRSYEIAKER